MFYATLGPHMTMPCKPEVGGRHLRHRGAMLTGDAMQESCECFASLGRCMTMPWKPEARGGHLRQRGSPLMGDA